MTTQMQTKTASRMGLAKAASIMAFLAVISKILGFVREMSLAAVFGATAATDAYLVAQTIPYLLFSTISYALTTTFIPIYSHVREEQGQDAAFALASTVMWIVLLLSLLFVVGGEFLATSLVRVVAPGFNGPVVELTAHLSRILFPMMVFQLLSGIMTGILQVSGEFVVPTTASLLQNVAIITSILLFSSYCGIGGVAVGTLVGTALAMLAKIPAVWRTGFRLARTLNFRDLYVKRMALLMLPAIMGAGATQINTLVDRILASGLPEGRVAALGYANRLMELAPSILGVSIITVVYPSMARLAARREWKELGNGLVDALNMICFMLMPIAVGVLVLRVPMVKIVFERGAFDTTATQETAWALLFLSIGIAFFAMRDLVSRAFFAVQDTTTPMLLGMVTVGVNVVLNLLLIEPLEQGGLALATSSASVIGLALGVLAFRRKLPCGLPMRRLLISQLRTGCASAVMGVVVFMLYTRVIATVDPQGGLMQLLCFAAVATAGAIVYFVIAWVLRIPELRVAQALLAKALSRL